MALAGRETFADLVEAIAERVDRRQTEGKAAYYAAALANGLTHDAPGDAEQAAMLDVLDALRPLQLTIVAILRDGRISPDETAELGAMIPILRRRIRGVSDDVLEGHYFDLQNYNIVPRFAEPLHSVAGSIFDLRHQMTRFGQRFADWISVRDG